MRDARVSGTRLESSDEKELVQRSTPTSTEGLLSHVLLADENDEAGAVRLLNASTKPPQNAAAAAAGHSTRQPAAIYGKWATTGKQNAHRQPPSIQLSDRKKSDVFRSRSLGEVLRDLKIGNGNCKEKRLARMAHVHPIAARPNNRSNSAANVSAPQLLRPPQLAFASSSSPLLRAPQTPRSLSATSNCALTGGVRLQALPSNREISSALTILLLVFLHTLVYLPISLGTISYRILPEEWLPLATYITNSFIHVSLVPKVRLRPPRLSLRFEPLRFEPLLRSTVLQSTLYTTPLYSTVLSLSHSDAIHS